MNLVEVLNAWAAAWSGFMVRAFIDSTALLASSWSCGCRCGGGYQPSSPTASSAWCS